MPFSKKRADRAQGFIECLRLTQGEWKDQKFKLTPWQRQIVRDVFGTVQKNDKGDTVRQYKTVYIELPKKSGKTGFSAALALVGLYADDEPGAEVYVAAVNKKQARICFDEARDMVKKNSLLRKLSKVTDSTKRIRVPGTSSLFEVLSADAPDKHGLKPSCVIIDEIHAHQDGGALYRVLTFGTGASRRQQLVIVITTAGDRKEGIAWELHQRAAQKIAAMKKRKPGEPEPDPSFYGVIFGADETDNWEDEEVWKRVNPSIGHTITLEQIRHEYSEVKGKPIDEALFKQLRLNVWGQPTTAKWLPVGVWDKAAKIPVDLKALIGRKGYGGLDLSSNDDMTAWLMLFEVPGDPEAVDVLARLWVPEAKLQDERNKNRYLYQDWHRRGFLQATPGDVIDFDFIEKQILEDAATYGVKEFNVDYLFQSRQICQRLASAGMTPVAFRQGFLSYGPVMSEFERRLLKGSIRHGGHPVLRWQFENLEVDRDSAGNLKPSKLNRAAKIDGIVALVMALDRVMRHGAAPSSAPATSEGEGKRVKVW